MNTIEYIHRALGVASAAGVPYANLAGIAVDLTSAISKHTGMTTDEIIEQAGVKIDENSQLLYEALKRLESSPEEAAVPSESSDQ